MRPKGISIIFTEQEISRFWNKVSIMSDKTKCWEWAAATIKGSLYGKVNLRGKFYLSHRLAYYIKFGDPGILLVCHKCDNQKCCNPNHLFLGTDKDNSEDMVSKNRVKKGENHWCKLKPEGILRGEQRPSSKLTTKQVIDIKFKYSQGIKNQYELARKYKVWQQTISKIVNNKMWANVLPKTA